MVDEEELLKQTIKQKGCHDRDHDVTRRKVDRLGNIQAFRENVEERDRDTAPRCKHKEIRKRPFEFYRKGTTDERRKEGNDR